ncbi:MAG TPA: glycoside hydrolase domain-containing protein [Puia sp.]|nr:glycoside hydrolase domain-containing protein [Puia sp.]
MKRKRITVLGCILLSLYTTAQTQKGEIDKTKVPEPKEHFQDEYTFDTATEPARWLNQNPGLKVSFASTDQMYFRTEVPDLKETSAWEIAGWKGERVNTMILVWSPDTLKQVRFVLKDLSNAKGQTLGKKNIQLNMVRYVVSNYPYNAPDATCDASPYRNIYLMPDRFEAFERFDLPGRTVRPVWLSLDIPATAEAGTYHGTIEVQCEKYKTTLQVNIRVQKQVLPAPHEWKYRLDIWQNPWVIAWYNHVKPWSAEHKELLKKHLALYAGAGGKYITTYAVHSPWSDNSYMIEETMIEWTKRQNGSWKFDYNIFDQYVQLAMEAGIDKAITIYTPVPWGNRFRYLDEKTGDYVYEIWPPGSVEFKNVWNAFLTDLQIHLQKKGWLEKTYLGINENTLEQTLATVKVIKAHSKNWKITYAGNWHQELDTLLNDYCFLYGNESDVNVVKKRAARGFTTTYYICCNPPKPNDFVFSPPVEGRWLSWYSLAHGYNGFLRWAYDAWPSDPERDARHTIWPAGDCFLVYPGGNSCTRFEKLREGIVDYEKISILRELASRSGDKEVKSQMTALDDHLQLFLNEHEFKTEKITSDVDKGKKMIEALSDELGK